jgi:hypothetical protein
MNSVTTLMTSHVWLRVFNHSNIVNPNSIPRECKLLFKTEHCVPSMRAGLQALVAKGDWLLEREEDRAIQSLWFAFMVGC